LLYLLTDGINDKMRNRNRILERHFSATPHDKGDVMKPIRLFAIFVLLLAITLAPALYVFARRVELRRAEQSLKDDFAARVANSLSQEIKVNLEILYGLQGLYNSSQNVSRKAFNEFAASALKRSHRIQALEWIPRISRLNRAKVERELTPNRPPLTFMQRSASGLLERASDRDFYYPVYYLAPFKGNESAYGYDLGSNPPRLKALDLARDTGKVVATEQIPLVQDKHGFLVIAPVYTGSPMTVEERRQQLKGFVLFVYRVKDLIGAPWFGRAAGRYSINISDVNDSEAEQSILKEKADESLNISPSKHTINVAGRTWSIVVQQSESSVNSELRMAPFLFSLLVFMFLTSLFYYLWNKENLSPLNNQLVKKVETLRINDEQMRQQTKVLMEISSGDSLTQNNVDLGFRMIVESLSATLKVERTSLWFPTADDTAIICQHLHIRSTSESASGQILECSKYPAYFSALCPLKPLIADQALTDQRTSELRNNYLQPLDIRSMLDIPFRLPNKSVGILCIEEVGSDRSWQTHEVHFASSMANLVSLAVETADRRRSEREVEAERLVLESKVRQRTQDLNSSLETLNNMNLQLKDASRHKSQFLSNMSHELRTPLNAVLGFSDLLEGQHFGKLNPKQAEYVLQIRESGADLLSLIDGLLDMAKIDAGTMTVKLEEFEFSDLLDAAISTLSLQIHSKQLNLVKAIDEQITLLYGDSRIVKQILLNLLSNAIKYTPSGGTIEIRAIPEKTSNRIEIADTGVGIEPDKLTKVFGEFYQADSSRDQELGGTGIGLALTRRFVELLGGRISVTSQVNEGSTFSFDLPLKNAVRAKEGQSKKSKTIRLYPYKRRVLVAEDNEANLKLFLSMLSIHRHQVTIARNGQEAVDFAKACNPEIIFMDIRMPVMDGLQATRLLRSESSLDRVPVIALTATTGKKAIAEQIEAGCNHHLPKPVLTDELFAVLKKYLPDVPTP
jgi:signal transduction histidine kinase/CheY-like chemotaxis protein/CHASE1-domain containing sensor protein